MIIKKHPSGVLRLPSRNSLRNYGWAGAWTLSAVEDQDGLSAGVGEKSLATRVDLDHTVDAGARELAPKVHVPTGREHQTDKAHVEMALIERDVAGVPGVVPVVGHECSIVRRSAACKGCSSDEGDAEHQNCDGPAGHVSLLSPFGDRRLDFQTPFLGRRASHLGLSYITINVIKKQ